MKYTARAPLRLGLAGGGTDVSPYCDIYGGCVLNATIDRYAYTQIKVIEKNRYVLISLDRDIKFELSIRDDLERIKKNKLTLHTEVLKHFKRNYSTLNNVGLELTTFCDAPIGSGLGSSSTLVVSMIKAFVEMLNLPLVDYEIANLAYKIERINCKLMGGRQDHYSATFGGFNFIEFLKNGSVIVNPLKIKNSIICQLEASLILFSTDISRESATIIREQSKNVISKNKLHINAMHSLKKEAYELKESLIQGDFKSIVKILKSGWINKKNSANSVTNKYLDQIYNSAIDAGALAGKVSGAGGGGFMLFYVPFDKRIKITKMLKEYKGIVSNCHFVKDGCQAW